jgi:acyl-CoA synthetase (NDP forming)
LVEQHKKPLIVHTSFAREPIKSLEILKSAGVPVIESSDRAAQCLSALMHFSINQQKLSKIRIPFEQEKQPSAVTRLFKKLRQENRLNLLETESRAVLTEYDIALPEAALATTAQQARDAASTMRYPLAMKVVSPDIIHKSDAGGIKLNLRDAAEVAKAFGEIMSNAEKATTKERVVGTLISPMAAPGQECIIGMIRDPQFGPVIMFGLGGIFVEVLKDVSFRVAPLAQEDIDEMIEEIKGYRVLMGIRGEKAKDVDALKDIIAKLSRMAIDNPEITEIDLNPVIVHEKGASIVDSRIILGSD